MGDVEELVKTVEDTKVELEGAERAAMMARSVETAARNYYNEACRELDAFIETMKQEAPHDSDWGQDRQRL